MQVALKPLELNLMFATLLICALIAGCSNQIVSPQVRQREALSLASQQGWEESLLTTTEFNLLAFIPSSIKKSDTLTVYLEGDGLAWVGTTTPSDNPTPINPVGLKLALQDESAAVYIARPCQYAPQGSCDKKYWTSHRFSAEVVNATDAAIDQVKARYGATRLILVGYSGGAAVAALVASARTDVVQLITIAGNLDHVFWTKQHHISPLTGSLNPADYWRVLQRIPQTHFVGEDDGTINRAVVDSYQRHMMDTRKVKVIVVPKFDHHCCWVRDWRQLKQQALE